ncbi:MAG: HAMP domain-containing sensor histidine kinase [Anaerolineales bacterium]
MFSSIRSRLLLTYLLLIAVTLGIVTLALVAFLIRNPRLAREAETNLALAANALERQNLAGTFAANEATISNAAEEADQLLGVRVMVFASNGTLVADSRFAAEGPLTLPANPPRRGTNAQVAEALDQNGETWIYISRGFPRGFTVAVAVPLPRAPLFAFFTDELFPPVVRAGLAALLLSLLLAFLMTRSITSPLQRVSAAARQFANGQRQVIQPEGPAELRQLARTFNEMGDKVVTSQQSQRDFVANISHDLKTPLTSIQGFAQAILDGTARGANGVNQAAQVISTEAGRMQSLVQDLLELARMDAGVMQLDLQTFEIETLVNEINQKFIPLASQAEVELKITLGDPLTIKGDFERLTQAISNLVENALKVSPPGKSVEVISRGGKGFVEIEVCDSGPGIPAKEAKRIFERFYQVDKSRKTGANRGAGLGLSIAQQILQAHGGSIRVESQVGAGARFIVRLPSAKKR